MNNLTIISNLIELTIYDVSRYRSFTLEITMPMFLTLYVHLLVLQSSKPLENRTRLYISLGREVGGRWGALY